MFFLLCTFPSFYYPRRDIHVFWIELKRTSYLSVLRIRIRSDPNLVGRIRIRSNRPDQMKNCHKTRNKSNNLKRYRYRFFLKNLYFSKSTPTNKFRIRTKFVRILNTAQLMGPLFITFMVKKWLSHWRPLRFRLINPVAFLLLMTLFIEGGFIQERRQRSSLLFVGQN